MSRHVSAQRLAILHVELANKARPEYKNGKTAWGEVDIREYSCIVEELRRRRGELSEGFATRAPLTKWMIESQVGEHIIIGPKTSGAITQCRTTARKAMGNPEARWQSDTLPNGRVRVERKPDGSDANFSRHRSPIILTMAAMNLNGRTTVDRQGRRIPHAYKVIARQLIGDPRADWRYEHLTTGRVRIRRTR